jgi:hypothetical protein
MFEKQWSSTLSTAQCFQLTFKLLTIAISYQHKPN